MRAIVSSLAALLTACAGVPRDPSLPIDDPNEAFNRKVSAFNEAILHPPATIVKALPAPVFDRLRDVDNNLKEPRIFGNDILQGRMNAAGITFARFIFNSTFGLGGLFDVASPGGLPKQTGDFGQTLFVWGVPAGTYTVSPYFGPATQRDAVGGVVDLVGDPVGWTLGGLRMEGEHRDRRVERDCASWPAEGGRGILDRFLQLPALRLLSDPPGGPARSARPASPDRVAGHVLAGDRFAQDRNSAVTMMFAASLPVSRRGARHDGPRCTAKRTGPANPAAVREPA